jgi:hypothetical protein
MMVQYGHGIFEHFNAFLIQLLIEENMMKEFWLWQLVINFLS